MHAVTLHAVSKTFQEGRSTILVLKQISLEIAQGEFFAIVGPSGSGKSTLLRIMSALEDTYDGTVSYGDGIAPNEFSFVFQQFALLPWLTVADNIGLGLVARGMRSAERTPRIQSALQELDLSNFADAYPKDLSGGMRQRVGIARALVTDPKVIFMDEPFSELDSFTAQELRHELLTIWEARKPTIILVTHIVEEAVVLADRIAVLTPRPGRIEQVFKNTLPRPRKGRTRAFYALEDAVTAVIRP
jgi:ABC-type nitrate/sulfonate/bicarbonate transport system ATPase subunit